MTIKHRMKGTKVYSAWLGMRARCSRPTITNHHNYGGRGIRVHPAWDAEFAPFYAYIGDPPSPKHSIDRIDNNKGYEPGNVRWATALEQNNNRRSSRILTYGGRSMTHAEWAREVGISPELLYQRLKRSWPLKRALSGIEMPQRSHRESRASS